jgi:hypothetical protein
LGFGAGGGTASVQHCTQTTIDISTVNTVIAGVELDGLLLVVGVNNGGDKRFVDLLVVSPDTNPVVINALNTLGSPVARQYSLLSTSLGLIMSSDTYKTTCYWIQIGAR